MAKKILIMLILGLFGTFELFAANVCVFNQTGKNWKFTVNFGHANCKPKTVLIKHGAGVQFSCRYRTWAQLKIQWRGYAADYWDFPTNSQKGCVAKNSLTVTWMKRGFTPTIMDGTP